MAPPLATDDGGGGDGGGGGRQKNSRKMKRLRDVSCMRKRETKQDLWGRQRGGRKARWDKLDRQPSAFKSRLRSGNSGQANDRLYAEEVFSLVDTIAIGSPAGNSTLASLTGGGDGEGGVGGGDRTTARDGNEGFDAEERRSSSIPSSPDGRDGSGHSVSGGTRTPSPKKEPQQEGSRENHALMVTPNGRDDTSWRQNSKSNGDVNSNSNSDGDGRQSLHVDSIRASASKGENSAEKTLSSPQVRQTGSTRVHHISSIQSPRGPGTTSSRGRRSSLRSPAAGSGGLSRSSSAGLGGRSGRGAFRGSPPPLHRRLTSPGSSGKGVGGSGGLSSLDRRSKGHRRQASSGGQGRVGIDAKRAAAAAAVPMTASPARGREEEEDDEVSRATPPPPPSLFESVFKNKLPSLTPRKAPPTTPRLSRDSIVHAIFQSLFGKRKVRSGPRERYGGDWDDEEGDEDEEGADEAEEEVDESWIKTGISLSLFSSRALDFACRSTAGADLLHQYVDSNAIFRLVTDLRFEDPRVPSPRLMIVKAIYENCAHLRLPTLRALAHASHDHLLRTRELEGWAAKAGIDMAEATAAAVSGGDVSGGSGAGKRLRSSRGPGGGTAGASGAGVGVGGSVKSVRVAGRDQSQTLSELLLFVLNTFPSFFLGMTAPFEHAEQQQQVGEGSGFLGANYGHDTVGADRGSVVDGGMFVTSVPGNNTGSLENIDENRVNNGVIHGSLESGGSEWSDTVATAGAEDPAAMALAREARLLSQSPGTSSIMSSSTDRRVADTAGAESPPRSDAEDGSDRDNNCGSAEGSPSVHADGRSTLFAAEVDGSDSGSDDPYDSTTEGGISCEVNDPPSQASAAVNWNGGNNKRDGDVGTATRDNGEDEDGQEEPGRLDAVAIGAERSPGSGGRPPAASTESPGGGPVLSADRCPPAWPSLPGSPSPKMGGDKGSPWSPAWATTGLRSLEEVEGGDSDASHEFPCGGGSNSGEAGDTVGSGTIFGSGTSGTSGNGAWGRGMASKNLMWGSSSVEDKEGARTGSVARTAAGPARALCFTTQDDEIDEQPALHRDEHAAHVSTATTDAVSNGTQGWEPNEEPSSVAPNPDEAIVDSGDVSSVAIRNSNVEAVTAAPGVAAAVAEAATTEAPPLPPAEGTTATAVGATTPAADSADAGWPATALKEITRSLCNLYASHGAPAAGGEAAATADAPERLQSLAAAGANLCHLWPPASALLLRRLLGTWPTGSARREVAYLRLIAGVACAAPPLEMVCPGSRVPLMLFRRLSKCINSPNTKVAQEAAYLVQADYMLMVYLAGNRQLMDLITTALCANRGHWSADVRGASEQAFDLMLDFL